MKYLRAFNKLFYRIFLPIFGDRKCIYTEQGADWWAWYASDTKRWIFEKGKYKV